MDDENNKKKKFSFLKSLGIESRVPTLEEKKQNKFYVGNASDAIIERKKATNKVLKELGD